jgi:hypothetical protein
MLARRAGFWLGAALLLAIAGCLAFLSTRWSVTADATAGARASLPAASRQLLDHLPGAMKVTCYASPASGLRPTVAAFVARYRRFKPDIALSFVDPEKDPAAMREAGISVDGEIVLDYHGHQQHLLELSDVAFGNALARLARGGERIVAFVTGDGERRADGQANADMGTFVGQLEQRGLRAVPLNFSQVTQVPEHTDLVVLASPLVALPAGAVKALTDYLAEGGNFLWLTEPDARDLGLAPLASALDVAVLPGMLVDGQGAALGLKDPRVVATGAYPPHAITAGFTLTTLFPQVAALAKTGGTQWQATPILASGPQSWNELQAIDDAQVSTIRYDAELGERKGPLDFGLALSRLSPNPTRREQRAVVIGDGDFLSNSFLGNGGNRAFGQRVFDWLLGDDVLAGLPARPAPDRHLALTQTGLDVFAAVFLLALPLVLLIVGAVVARRRWRR